LLLQKVEGIEGAEFFNFGDDSTSLFHVLALGQFSTEFAYLPATMPTPLEFIFPFYVRHTCLSGSFLAKSTLSRNRIYQSSSSPHPT
jgi:hypothetical protein